MQGKQQQNHIDIIKFMVHEFNVPKVSQIDMRDIQYIQTASLKWFPKI